MTASELMGPQMALLASLHLFLLAGPMIIFGVAYHFYRNHHTQPQEEIHQNRRDRPLSKNAHRVHHAAQRSNKRHVHPRPRAASR